MTTGLKIKDVADASGFSANTLRYYEQIGLLPESARTAAGYRMYDERTLERLAFISRAKQLGCTLDEITDLSVAWDGGQCGAIQARLRVLVSDKIVAAQQQLAELMTFTSELQHAAVDLERHRPDGPCDDGCGCITDPDDTTTTDAPAQPVSFSTTPRPSDDEPAVACTLAAGSMKGRVDDWQALLAHVERRERIDDGVRSVFADSVPMDDLIGLVRAEHDCCRFFRFNISVDTRGIALEVRAPHDALPVIESMFGAPA